MTGIGYTHGNPRFAGQLHACACSSNWIEQGRPKPCVGGSTPLRRILLPLIDSGSRREARPAINGDATNRSVAHLRRAGRRPERTSTQFNGSVRLTGASERGRRLLSGALFFLYPKDTTPPTSGSCGPISSRAHLHLTPLKSRKISLTSRIRCHSNGKKCLTRLGGIPIVSESCERRCAQTPGEGEETRCDLSRKTDSGHAAVLSFGGV